jgi:hypothetical protein
MAVRLSALRTGRTSPQNILVFISARDKVNSRTTMRLEGLCKLKKFCDLEPATLRLVA